MSMNRLKCSVVVLLSLVFGFSGVIQPFALYAETLDLTQEQSEVSQPATESASSNVSTGASGDQVESDSAAQDPSTPDSSEAADTESASADAATDEVSDEVSDDGIEAPLVENSWRYVDGSLRSDLPDDYGDNADFEGRAMHSMPKGATAQGIDVSEHNGTIDWQAVKDAGIDFAILRVGFVGDTSGGRLDYYFKRNVSECERLGIPYGVYLYSYARNEDEAKAEARLMLSALKGHSPAFPVYYDLEEQKTNADGSPMWTPFNDSSKLASIAKTFCGQIAAAGYKPGIYANVNWFKNYLTDPCFLSSGWSIWTAQYWYGGRYDECLGLTPDAPAKYDCWQYSSRGSVPGVNSDVDVNYWFGDSSSDTSNDTIAAELERVAQRYSSQLGAVAGEAYKYESDNWRLDCEHGCVVFSRENGAHPVWGDIYTYWNSETNVSSIGVPVGEPHEFSTSHGSGWSQDFEQGAIQWNGSDGYVSVRSGAIRTEYVRRGYQAGALGWPVAEAEELEGGGSRQRFQGGTIVTSEHGTFEMDGEMEALWNKLGGVSGLGYPLTNAAWFPQNGGGYSTDFESGSIAWTSSHHAVSVRSGAIRDEYVRRGYQAGALGWPVAEAEELEGGGSRQRFQGGVISVSNTGSVSVDTNYQGFQNPFPFYQVSNRSVSIPHQGQGIFGYRTPSRIGLYATRNECIEAAISRAYDYLGTPYRWDYSCAPGVGIDCAGLVMQSLYATGMDLGRYNPWDHFYTPGHDHYANDMWNDPKFMRLAFSQRRRGDLICYPGHIAIYLGNDTIIEAYPPQVRISSVYSSGYIKGVLRPFV